MKLIEIHNNKRGTYFGLRPTPETIRALREFMGDHKIPNPVDDSDLHATVVYSKVFVGASPLGKLKPTWKTNFTEYDIFRTSPKLTEQQGDTKNCLVMKFDCPELHERHHYLRNHHGATHDYPSFIPHMTLSYDVGDFDHNILPEYDGTHEFHEEYSEPLNSNWAA
jgi:hypothetical protein